MSGQDDEHAERLLEALDPDQRSVAQFVSGPMAVLAGLGRVRRERLPIALPMALHAVSTNRQMSWR